MRWEPDVSRGDWVRDRMVARFGDLRAIVPGGFEAFARILHPVSAQRPVGATWEEVRSGASPEDWEYRDTTWAEAAEHVGVTWHPLVQWNRIAATDPANGSWNGIPGRDGWRFAPPSMGDLDAETFAIIARALARHTSTPGAGCAAVWEGHGGMLSDAGFAVLTFSALGETDASATDASGIRPPLGPEVDAGPRFSLPDREHVLFEAGIAEFEASDWPARAPWARTVWNAPSPNLVWPEDRAWVLATEIDFDSTVVGGSSALVEELVGTAGLEAVRIPADADLTWDGDLING
ncbi:hypothetical protein [Agromyces sp. LHK192]|uniref:hypothetical protein n=1 Tax=Agromyces sp. LHK192 TaxID=2498704 RepID=UPI00196B28E9|nr:hypothetical protein [Agromyces sp. LHK192]